MERNPCSLTIVFLLAVLAIFSTGCKQKIESPLVSGLKVTTDTVVEADGRQQPTIRTVTVFFDFATAEAQPRTSGRVTELSFEADQSQPFEIVQYDFSTKSLTLVDPERRVFCHVTDKQLDELASQMLADVKLKEKIPLLIEPQLVSQTQAGGEIVLSQPGMKYQVQGQPHAAAKADATDDVLRSGYFDYLDRRTQLNLTTPGAIPPFARLEVNQSLRKAGLLPTEIRLEMDIPGRPKLTAVASSQWDWDVKNETIEEFNAITAKAMKTARSVGISEYRGLTATGDPNRAAN